MMPGRVGSPIAPRRGSPELFGVGAPDGLMFSAHPVWAARPGLMRSQADVAQLVARHLAKVKVAGSIPVVRSERGQWPQPRWSGREARQRPAKPCTRVRIPSPPRLTTHSTARAISSVGERFLDAEEVTGSIPVSPTTSLCRSEPVLNAPHGGDRRHVGNRHEVIKIQLFDLFNDRRPGDLLLGPVLPAACPVRARSGCERAGLRNR